MYIEELKSDGGRLFLKQMIPNDWVGSVDTTAYSAAAGRAGGERERRRGGEKWQTVERERGRKTGEKGAGNARCVGYMYSVPRDVAWRPPQKGKSSFVPGTLLLRSGCSVLPR